jgi:hypothetical protein
VIDLVTVLDATVGADTADPQTSVATGHIPGTYQDYLKADALEGARLGLLTGFVGKDSPYGEVSRVFQQAVEFMGNNGAEVVELHIDGLDELLNNSSVIDLEFKFDLERYLRQSDAPVKTLSEILESGQYHRALEKRYRRSEKAEANSKKYQERLRNRTALAQTLRESMTSNKLDALVYPTIRVKPSFIGEGQFGSVCWIAAHSGFPAITLPAGFTEDGLPVGLELLARPFEEGRLLGLAYAYEQMTETRRPPPRAPSLVNDVSSYRFEIRSTKAGGELLLDRPSQTLHYDIRVPGASDRDILDIKIHRGGANTQGPAIELLGKERKGAVEVRNSDLQDLLAGGLYMMIYTREAPQGLVRGQIELLESPSR